MLDTFKNSLDVWSTAAILVGFTIVFILLDEFVAKPVRRYRMEQKAKTDPVVREALEISDRVHALQKQGKLTA